MTEYFLEPGGNSNYSYTRVWFCGRCHGLGKYNKTDTKMGYPFYYLVNPCDNCGGEGYKLVKSVKVRDQLL